MRNRFRLRNKLLTLLCASLLFGRQRTFAKSSTCESLSDKKFAESFSRHTFAFILSHCCNFSDKDEKLTKDLKKQHRIVTKRQQDNAEVCSTPSKATTEVNYEYCKHLGFSLFLIFIPPNSLRDVVDFFWRLLLKIMQRS